LGQGGRGRWRGKKEREREKGRKYLKTITKPPKDTKKSREKAEEAK
jgi:hypothetical protein